MSWTKIQGDELQRLQTRLEMPPQTTILEASTLRTPFYHNGELVKMNDGMSTMFMVAAGPGELSAREFYPLTGTSEEIRAANKAASGDWGCVDAEDRKTNFDAMFSGERILSAYPIDPAKPCEGFGANTLWIITESDRSATTFLLPGEY
jgi:hypothetical protein